MGCRYWIFLLFIVGFSIAALIEDGIPGLMICLSVGLAVFFSMRRRQKRWDYEDSRTIFIGRRDKTR